MGIDRAAIVALAASCIGLAAGAVEAPLDTLGATRIAVAPLFLIDEETRVESLEFRFAGTSTLEESRLESRIALAELGTFERFRRAMSWLPFVSAPERMLFDPVTLQKDKVRLQRFYRAEGFPRAEVAYEVSLDTEENTVAIEFVIDEGEPRIVHDVQLVDVNGDEIVPEADLEPAWRDFVEELDAERGQRASDVLCERLRHRAVAWWRDHEHAFAEVSAALAPAADDELAVTLTLSVQPGPRTVVGDIFVQGNERIKDGTLRRQLPFRRGDPFRASQLAEGQKELFGLELVRLALVSVADTQNVDTTADVLVRVEEGSLRTVEAAIGYTSEEGITALPSWTHRNFWGGARSLQITGDARTGLWSLEEGPNSRYGLIGSLRQPFLGGPRLSGLFGAFVEYGDTPRDESVRVGFDATALWERHALRTWSVSYGFSHRKVFETRGGGLGEVSDYLGFLETLDEVDVDTRTSALGVAASWGEVDDLIFPSSGWVTRLRAELAGPSGLSNVEYARIGAGADRFFTIGGKFGLALRAQAGRLFPFGTSVPSESGGDDALVRFLRLRDAVFTSGGTESVRGWGSELLGPKVPDIPVETVDGEIRFGEATRYAPLGGFQRYAASIELQAPMPFLGGRHGVYAFLDAGRVWTTDDRFVDPGGASLLTFDDGTFYGTGAGLQFATPVGPVRIAVGYKLNPSVFDLRDPGAVADALLGGTPVEAVPEDEGRRWQAHLSIGGSL